MNVLTAANPLISHNSRQAQQQQQCAGDGMNVLAAANLLSSHNSRQAQQQSDRFVEQA
jgi:hypothetical protein